MKFILIVAVIAFTIRAYLRFRALQAARRKSSFFKALGFEFSRQVALANYGESFALLNRLTLGPEVFTARREDTQITVCNASLNKRYKPDLSEITVFFYQTSDDAREHTIILPKSFHALSSVPAMSLPLLEETIYPTLSKHFVIRSHNEDKVKDLLSPQLMLALESLKEASIEIRAEGVLFTFPGNRFDPSQVKHLVQETQRFVTTLQAFASKSDMANS